MTLGTLQRRMQEAIRGIGEAPPLAGDGRGLEAYRYAWRARMHEALRSNYPVLHRVLGDDAFAAMADDYLVAEPSGFRSIRWFGHRLDEHLRGRAEHLPHPAVADMARFEWAICEAFDGPDAPPMAVEALAALAPEDWPGLRLVLHPTCRLLELDWSVAPIWRELAEADDPNHQAAPPEPLAHTVLVWRKSLQPRWRSVEALEAGLLQAIASGQDFSALCALAAAAVDDEMAAATVVQYVRRWLADGLLAAPPS